MSKQVMQYQLGKVKWTRRPDGYYCAWINSEFFKFTSIVLELMNATPLPNPEESEIELLECPTISIGLLDANKKYVYADRSLEMWMRKVTNSYNQLQRRVTELEGE